MEVLEVLEERNSFTSRTFRTPEQISRHNQLQQSGAIVLVVDSFEKFIKDFSTIYGNFNYLDSLESSGS